MLIGILRAEEPTHLLFCFDAGEETFRHQENATYKEGRAETPDEFFPQIPRVIEMIETWGFRHVSAMKYEADDFLCTYTKEAEKEGMRVTIVTGDRDAFQLATKTTRVAIPHKGYQAPEYLDDAAVFAKYGIRPDQVASYKGLTGDASDNLPGVKGIGPKTAADLLQKYDTLAGVYEHLSEIKDSVRAKLEKDRESAFFCEHMAQLICDIPLPLPLSDTALIKMDPMPVINLFDELEFSSLGKRFQTIVQSDYGRKHFLHDAIPVSAVQPNAAPEKSSEGQLSMF